MQENCQGKNFLIRGNLSLHNKVLVIKLCKAETRIADPFNRNNLEMFVILCIYYMLYKRRNFTSYKMNAR